MPRKNKIRSSSELVPMAPENLIMLCLSSELGGDDAVSHHGRS
jgi:hypothetical protein